MFSWSRIKRYIKTRYFGHYIDLANTEKKIRAILSEQTSILDKQGFLQGTDKSSLIVHDTLLESANDYLRHYDYMFSSFRADKFSLIEFGCLTGASLRTWAEYFPHAEIFGVDLNEDTKQLATDRIHIVIGDATSQQTYDTLKAATGGSAFIILDDASHAWSDQRRSFELFWDMIAPGGFYVVEDLGCGTLGAYPAYPPKVLDSRSSFDYMQDRCKCLCWDAFSQPEKHISHFLQLPPQVQKIEREIDMCTFIHGTVIIRKKA